MGACEFYLLSKCIFHSRFKLYSLSFQFKANLEYFGIEPKVMENKSMHNFMCS